MQKSWWDFLLGGLCVAALFAASLACVWAMRPWTASWFGDYHVVVDTALLLIGYGLLSACAVHGLLRLKPVQSAPAAHGMDGAQFAYWKLLTILYRLGQGALRWVVPFFARHCLDALFGARIGRNVASGATIDDPYMVTIGNDVILGNAALVSGNYLDNGRLVCGPVVIGNQVTIGANAIVMPNTVIGDGATVMSGARVGPNARIQPGEVWHGNPARRWTSPAQRAAGSPPGGGGRASEPAGSA